MKSICLLRFRDFDCDTIKEHVDILRDKGSVWWGWWKKEAEKDKIFVLGKLDEELKRKGSVQIGLFDASMDRYFVAAVEKCEFSSGKIKCPAPDYVPSYYRDRELRAWFLINAIEELRKEDFEKRFGGVPLGDETLFEASHIKSYQLESVQIPNRNILHISDLHFGSDFGYSNSSRFGGRSLDDIICDDVKLICPEGVGMLILSGDLSSRADANVLFDPVLPFLERLIARLEILNKQVIIVPGNHDIPLQKHSPTDYNHEAAFMMFMRRFYNEDWLTPRLLRFTSPKGDIEVLPIHSVKLRSPQHKSFGYAQWKMYDDYLKGINKNGALRIAVLHHHLTPAPREEMIYVSDDEFGNASLTLDAGAIIEGLQTYGFKLVFHGHQHVPRITKIARGRYPSDGVDLIGIDDDIFVISGGSAGAKRDRLDPEMPENCYGLLKLDSDSCHLRVRRYTSAGSVKDQFKTVFSI